MKKILLIFIVAICFGFTKEEKNEIYTDGFIGEVRLFAGNFAPRGWAFCDGQLLSISTNSALFSILGTMYGGDGRTSFALPDLRGRVAVGPRTGSGLNTYYVGQKGGAETTTINVMNIPAMSYGIPAYEAENLSDEKINSGTQSLLTTGNNANSTFKTTINGRAEPINNLQPYTSLNYIICIQGTYPSRS